MAKKLARIFSTSIGNPWHGQVKSNTRRKLSLKSKGRKK